MSLRGLFAPASGRVDVAEGAFDDDQESGASGLECLGGCPGGRAQGVRRAGAGGPFRVRAPRARRRPAPGLRCDHPAAQEILPAAARGPADVRGAGFRERDRERALCGLRGAPLRLGRHPADGRGLLRQELRHSLHGAPEERDPRRVRRPERVAQRLRRVHGHGDAGQGIRCAAHEGGRPLRGGGGKRQGRSPDGGARGPARRGRERPEGAGAGLGTQPEAPAPARAEDRSAGPAGPAGEVVRPSALGGEGEALPLVRLVQPGVPDVLLLQRAGRGEVGPAERRARAGVGRLHAGGLREGRRRTQLPQDPRRAVPSPLLPQGKYLWDQHKQIACVGCGRCITACTTKIANPVEVYNRLSEVGS